MKTAVVPVLLVFSVPAFAIDPGVSLDGEYIGDVIGVSTWVLLYGLGFVAGSIR